MASVYDYVITYNDGNAPSKIKKLGDSANMAQTASAGLKGTIGGLVAGFAALGAVSFAKDIAESTAEYQKFDAILTNMLGSASKAGDAMAYVQDFASKTPFSVRELTSSFISLVGSGIEPSEKAMTDLGDFASASGKGMGDLIEAIKDVNNTERWKEMQVKVQQSGDKMTGTFRGMTVQVANTQEGAAKMIQEFAKIQGVGGSMAAISGTLGGKLSNLGDAFDRLKIQIGQSSGVGFDLFLNSANYAIEFISKVIPKIGQAFAPLTDLIEKQFSGLDSAFGTFKIPTTGELAGNFIDTLRKITEVTAPVFATVISSVRVAGEIINKVFGKIFESERIAQSVGRLSSAFDSLYASLSNDTGAGLKLIEIMGVVVDYMANRAVSSITFFIDTLRNLYTVFEGVWNFISGAVHGFYDFFTGDFQGAWDNFGKSFSGIASAFDGAFSQIFANFKMFYSQIFDTLDAVGVLQNETNKIGSNETVGGFFKQVTDKFGTKEETKKNFGNFVENKTTGQGMAGGASGLGGGIGGGANNNAIKGIQGEDKQAKIITVNINSLINTFNQTVNKMSAEGKEVSNIVLAQLANAMNKASSLNN